MSDRDDRVRDVAREQATPNFIDNKGDYIEYYKEQYGTNWTRKAAENLYGSVKNKQGENVSISNIMRRFQGGRELKGLDRSTPLYQEAGQKLPPSSYTPKGEITITFKGDQGLGKDRGTRERNWTTTFSGTDAYDFVNKPNFRDFMRHQGYPDSVIDRLEEGDYEVMVTSVS